MGRYIIKIKDKYLIWSTIVDSPVTIGMTKAELTAYVKEEQGNEGLRALPKRLERVEKQGTSAFARLTLDELLAFNRAGCDPDGTWNESCWTAEQIYEHYCKAEGE